MPRHWPLPHRWVAEGVSTYCDWCGLSPEMLGYRRQVVTVVIISKDKPGPQRGTLASGTYTQEN